MVGSGNAIMLAYTGLEWAGSYQSGVIAGLGRPKVHSPSNDCLHAGVYFCTYDWPDALAAATSLQTLFTTAR